jgi:hypothetical protein
VGAFAPVVTSKCFRYFTSLATAAGSAEPACPAFVAFVALTALVAEGTVPRLLSLKSFPVSEPFLTFELVTAFFLSCLLPTLFFGSFRAA